MSKFLKIDNNEASAIDAATNFVSNFEAKVSPDNDNPEGIALAEKYLRYGRGAHFIPELQNAARLEASIENQLLEKFPDKHFLVAQGRQSAIDHISQLLRQGKSIPELPKVSITNEEKLLRLIDYRDALRDEDYQVDIEMKSIIDKEVEDGKYDLRNYSEMDKLDNFLNSNERYISLKIKSDELSNKLYDLDPEIENLHAEIKFPGQHLENLSRVISSVREDTNEMER